jgi:hypothetical protein
MRNRLLIVGILIGVALAVGAMVFRSASAQVVVKQDRFASVLLAGGVE